MEFKFDTWNIILPISQRDLYPEKKIKKLKNSLGENEQRDRCYIIK